MVKANNLYNDDEKDVKALSRAEALALFGQERLHPKIKSPWVVVNAQIILTGALCLLVTVFKGQLGVNNLGISIFFGGILGVIPTIAFILLVELVKRSVSFKPQLFVRAMIYGEFIKVTLTITIILLVIQYFPNLNWLAFLITYIMVVQCYWLPWVVKNKIFK